MYCNFFGFSQKPFDVTPDPKFLYLTPGHREALASLVYGIHERKGFMVLVGEVGTGKTTLLKTVLRQLEKEIEVRVGVIFNTELNFNNMLTMALVDLGLAKAEERVSKVKALQRLNDFATRQLSRGGNVVLLVDEAQNLKPAAMENLRLLSNLETYRNKLIQIVLSGQPELDAKLNRPELRQLSQRITIKRYITPLSEREAYEYIHHRLSIAGHNGTPLFGPAAQKLIWEYSEGVPRKINVLCDNALLIAYALRQQTIEEGVVKEAIQDLSWSPFAASKEIKTSIPLKARSPVQQLTTAPVVEDAIGDGVGLSPAPSPSHDQDTIADELEPQVSGTVSPLTATISRFQHAKPAALALAGCVVLLFGIVLGRSDSVIQWTSNILASRTVRGTTSGQETGDGPLAQGGRDASGESAGKDSRVVVAKRGDNLFWIIVGAYGKYDGQVLKAVLQENPEIRDPDVIVTGQVIKLPQGK
jgi:general secretion pathway protein A